MLERFLLSPSELAQQAWQASRSLEETMYNVDGILDSKTRTHDTRHHCESTQFDLSQPTETHHGHQRSG